MLVVAVLRVKQLRVVLLPDGLTLGQQAKTGRYFIASSNLEICQPNSKTRAG
jgi:hypothetical protein